MHTFTKESFKTACLWVILNYNIANKYETENISAKPTYFYTENTNRDYQTETAVLSLHLTS